MDEVPTCLFCEAPLTGGTPCMESQVAEDCGVRTLLCLDGWEGYSETPVHLVGETPKQYRIQAIERTKLAGRSRWLKPGARVLVPKRAIRRRRIE